MLRQALIIPSRALRSSTRSIAQRATIRPQNFIAPIAVRRITPTAARWYSEAPKESKEAQEAQKKDGEAEANPAAEGQETAEPAGPVEDPVVTELKKQLEIKDKEAVDWKDKCLRTIADFRNLQDRTQREVKNAREFAITSFAKDLVDTVDNLDRALSMVPQEKLKAEEKSEELTELVNLYDGIKMTDDILLNTLRKHGLERFDPMGEKFDPNMHEAVTMLPQEGKENNTVFFVQSKGFRLNGRVLRAAQVGVVKN